MPNVALVSGNIITNSIAFDTGTNFGIGLTAASYKLDVDGTIRGNTASYFATIGGNVGIGTTSPQQKLVVSNSGVEGIEFVPASTANTNLIQSYNRSTSSYNTLVIRAADYNLQIGVTPAMFINSTGNLGLGTNSPNYRLDVAGAISMHDEEQDIDSRYYGGTFLRGWSSFNNGSESNITYTTDLTAPVGPEILSVSSYVWARGPRMRLDRTQNYEVEMWIKRQSGSSSGTFYMVVSNYTSNGTVISGDGGDWHYPAAGLVPPSTWTKYRFIVGPYGGSKDHASNASYISVGFIANYVGSTDVIYMTGFKCRPIPTYRDNITLFNDGKVGIGLTGPTERLHVSGNLRVTGTFIDSTNSAGSNGQVLTSTGTGTDWKSLTEITGVDGTGTANYIPKWTDADTIGNSLIFDNGTNVGIGTTSPDRKLQLVVSPATNDDDGINIFNGTNRFIFTRTGASYSYRGVPANAGMIYSETNISTLSDGGHISWHTNTGEHMRLTAAGNVGVGTISPQRLLHIQSANGVASQIQLGQTSQRDYYIGMPASQTYLDFFDASAGASRMVITSAGSVGIGTTTPNARVEINSGSVSPSVLLVNSTPTTYTADMEVGNISIGSSFGGTNNISVGRIRGFNLTNSSSTDGYLTFETRRTAVMTEAMRITSTGRILMNTTTDNGYDLNINGRLWVNSDAVMNGDHYIGGADSVGHYTSMILGLGVGTTQSVEYEVIRAFYDFNDWSETGVVEIELHEKYYSPGLKKTYVLTFGYIDNVKMELVGMIGEGYNNNFQLKLGPKTAVGGDIYYYPVLLQIRNYCYVDVVIKSRRPRTTLRAGSSEQYFTRLYIHKGATASNISDFTADSTVYMNNAASNHYFGGNVGIGATGPQYRLEVSQSTVGTFTGIALRNSSPTANNSVRQSFRVGSGASDEETGSITISREADPNKLFQFDIGGTGRYVWRIDNTERMRITSAGDVGIGTPTPTSVSGYTSLTINNTTTGGIIDLMRNNSIISRIYANNSEMFIGTTIATYLQIATNNIERMRITAAGNVGIGTTTPSARLSVIGDGTGTALIGSAGFTTQNYTGISLNGTLSQTNYNILSSPTDSTLYINRPSGNTIRYREANGTDQMVIASGGNVGIGTIAPSHKLEINSTPSFSSGGNIGANTSHIIGTIGASSTFSSGRVWAGLNSYINYPFGGSSTVNEAANLTGVMSVNRVGFSTAGTITMQAASGGQLRTMAAVTAFMQTGATVSGGIISHVSSIYVPGIYPEPGTSAVTFTNYFGILINPIDEFGYSSATNKWAIYQAGTGDNNYFAGNVGINVTAPTQKLDVDGRVRIRTIDVNNSPTTYLTINGDGVIQQAGIPGGWDANIYNTNGTLTGTRTITTSGNNMVLSGSSGDLVVQNTSGTNKVNYSRDGVFASGISLTLFAPTNEPIIFYSGNGPAARFTPDKRLLIGTITSSGDYLLEVNGNTIIGGMLRNVGKIWANGTIFSNSGITEASGWETTSITMGYSSTGSYGWITAGAASSRTALCLNAGGGFVGINTTAPAYPLDIPYTTNGDYAVIGSLRISRDGNGPTLDPFDRPLTIWNQGKAGYLYGSTFDSIGRWGINTTSVASKVLTINGNVVIGSSYVNTTTTPSNGMVVQGNVGIGTDNPLYTLQVGSFTGENIIMIAAETNSVSGLNFGDGTGAARYAGFIQYFHSSDEMRFGTSTSERMKITSAGTLVVGTITPISSVAGRIEASQDIVAYSTSDSRLKENKQPIENALDKLSKISGVSFDWKEDSISIHGYKGKDVGVIAQEVREVLPEAVRENETGYLAVRYEKIIPLLIEAIKDLQSEVASSKKEIEELKKRLA